MWSFPKLGELTVTQDDRTVRALAPGALPPPSTSVWQHPFYDVDGASSCGRIRLPTILQEKSVLVNTFSGQGEITLRQSVDGVRASADDYETPRSSQGLCLQSSPSPLPWREGPVRPGFPEEGYGNLRGQDPRAVPAQYEGRGFGAGCPQRSWGHAFRLRLHDGVPR